MAEPTGFSAALRLGVHGHGLGPGSPLGPLELAVMNEVWTQGWVSAASTQAALANRRRIALSTVQSTLDRLYRKRLLSRRKSGRAYEYGAAVSRKALIGTLVTALIEDLSIGSAGPDPTVVHAVDARAASDRNPADIDEATLRRLEAWIADCRGHTDGGAS